MKSSIHGDTKGQSLRPFNDALSASSDRSVFFDDLQIVIPFRDAKLTKEALKYAKSLIEDQAVRVRLIDVVVVPPGVSLDHPAAEQKRAERRLRTLARQAEVSASIEVVYARNWEF